MAGLIYEWRGLLHAAGQSEDSTHHAAIAAAALRLQLPDDTAHAVLDLLLRREAIMLDDFVACELRPCTLFEGDVERRDD